MKQRMHEYELESYLVQMESHDYEIVFGKHKGKSLSSVAKTAPGYLLWMLSSNFPAVVHTIVQEEIRDILPRSNDTLLKNS